MVLLLVSFSLLTIVLTAMVFLKLNIPINLGPGFVLETALNKPSGFSATLDLRFLHGQSGITVTALRPIGCARFGEGIVTTVGSAIKYTEVLENPGSISQNILRKGLDSGTAFKILSIDIADVDVGRNIGAKLQADQAMSDRKVVKPKPKNVMLSRWVKSKKCLLKYKVCAQK